MIYNLKTDKQKAKDYFEKLLDKECKIELKEKKPKRSYKQNAYLHLIITYFAIETGYSAEYVKRQFFKYVSNYQIFVKIVDGKMGEVQELKSTTELDTKEMTLAIDRFRDWSSSEAGIYLPEANEHQYLQQIQEMADNYSNKQYY